MINPTVKKHFLKFGLSEKALQGLSDSVTGSLDENATDEEITAKCKELEPFAKTFQSEIDARVNTALKKKEQTGDETGADDDDPEPAEKKKPKNSVMAKLEELTNEIKSLKSENAVKSNNEKVVERLKSIEGISDKEVESLMLGRKFENDEQIEDFVTKQSEIYSEIVQQRAESKAGNGYTPPNSNGSTSKAQMEAEIKAFNDKF